MRKARVCPILLCVLLLAGCNLFRPPGRVEPPLSRDRSSSMCLAVPVHAGCMG